MKGGIPLALSEIGFLESLAEQIERIIREDYHGRFAKAFRIAASWNEARPEKPADQIRNAFDHLSNVSSLAARIVQLEAERGGKRRAGKKRKPAGKLKELSAEAQTQVMRAQRHIAVGRYLCIECTIDRIARLSTARINEAARRRAHMLDDQLKELKTIYEGFANVGRPSLVRARTDARLLDVTLDTHRRSDAIDIVAHQLTQFFLELDLIAPRPTNTKSLPKG